MSEPAEVARDLVEARARTLELVADLDDEQMIGPRLAIVNPLLWEIGHIGWFQERFLLREHYGESPGRDDADELWDSMAVPHDTRWDLPLPSREETIAYMEEVQARIRRRLEKEPSPRALHLARLVLAHEDMHAEAFLYTRQTLAYPAPELRNAGRPETQGDPAIVAGEVEIPGGTFLLGATSKRPFVHDNELEAHEVEVEPFRIDRAPVTNARIRDFVEDGGYERRELWSEAGWAWREEAGAEEPLYWERSEEGGWRVRRWDRTVPLEEELPAVHLNFHEAQAWCRWAGRRLPSEAEWELAAAADPGRREGFGRGKRRHPWGDEPPTPARANLDGHALGCAAAGAYPEGESAWGLRQMTGEVWEWTASPFAPYPGFEPDAYEDYSKPWFGGTHRVLRGSSWATCSRMARNTWRNYFELHRRDVFAGFRTCAPRP